MAEHSDGEDLGENVLENASSVETELYEGAVSNSTFWNGGSGMTRQLRTRRKTKNDVVMASKNVIADQQDILFLMKTVSIKAKYDATLLLDELGQTQILQSRLKSHVADALAPDLTSPRYCARKDGKGGCLQGFACNSFDSLIAQGGQHWMPCGALTLGVSQHQIRCPVENIITTEAECRSASEQFQKHWLAKLASGFPRTSRTSDLQFRYWRNDMQAFRGLSGWTDHGFEPFFRAGVWKGGNSKAPLGCSMDITQNVVYWNEYKMHRSQQQEWEQDATYTEMGGLIHAEEDTRGAWRVGVCKVAPDLTNPRYCARNDGQGGCLQGFACRSFGALIAQEEKYWMPCGALTLEVAVHQSRCPVEKIITTEAECRSASEQFQKHWLAKLASGFARTSTTSDFQFRYWQNDLDAWKGVSGWTDHGYEPQFRAGVWKGGNSKAPLGCSMDKNGNVVYWNEYKMHQSQQEWKQDATYTEMGGLIHAEDEGGAYRVGVCKA
jgi:hypothetical protein